MNKSFIAVLAFVIGTTCVRAQTSSGNMMIGGGLSINSVSYEAGAANNENTVTFSPAFGYFIGDNLAVGTTLTVSSHRDGTGDNKTVSSSFGLGPFARYYIFTSNESFGFFGQAQLSFSSGKTNPPLGADVKSTAISFALSPGAAFFFNEHWAIEFAIRGFVFTARDPNTSNDNDKYSTVELGLNSFSPTLGFRYHF